MKGTEVPLWGSRIKSLELELKIVKANLAPRAANSEPLSSLYGLLKDQSESTDEEIQEAQYRLSEEAS